MTLATTFSDHFSSVQISIRQFVGSEQQLGLGPGVKLAGTELTRELTGSSGESDCT